MRTSRIAGMIAAIALLVVGLSTSGARATSDQPAQVSGPQPIAVNGQPDPGVAVFTGGDRAALLSTGEFGGTVRTTDSLGAGGWGPRIQLFRKPNENGLRMPTWAASRSVFSPDAVYIDGKWVVYFAAIPKPHDGKHLKNKSRCIGVATSRWLTGGVFHFVEHPLVCPADAGYASAEDQMTKFPGIQHAGNGVIGDSPLMVRNGSTVTRYLAYKVQSRAGVSAIRLVQLSDDGMHVASGTASRQILHSVRGPNGVWDFSDTIEAPVIVQRAGHFVAFTAKGNYARCTYSTGYYVSDSVWHWDSSARYPLLNSHYKNKVCGPGTADVTIPRSRNGQLMSYIAYNGWLCPSGSDNYHPCPDGTGKSAPVDQTGSRRVVFLRNIVWSGTTPKVTSGFLP